MFIPYRTKPGRVTHCHQETICAGCGEKSTTTKTVSLPFFPLEEYRDWLKKYTGSAHLNAPLQKWMGEILGSPLDDFPLTLPLIWEKEVGLVQPKTITAPFVLLESNRE